MHVRATETSGLLGKFVNVVQRTDNVTGWAHGVFSRAWAVAQISDAAASTFAAETQFTEPLRRALSLSGG